MHDGSDVQVMEYDSHCVTCSHVSLRLFSSVSLETPRPSNEEGSRAELALITQKLLDFGAAHGLDCAVDDAGNVRLRKAASAGYENATAIVLQSHMDVVCSKANDKEHNFFTDPVTPIVEGNVLRADRTTLGADDGIGVAASLAVLELADPAFVHGPLEAVFTVDEETTMGGAEGIVRRRTHRRERARLW